MIFDSTSQSVIQFLRAERVLSAKRLVDAIKKDCPMPTEIAARGETRRWYYEGRGLELFKANVLNKLYPEGMRRDEIHPVAINYFKTFAVTLADVYRLPPTRKVRGGTEAQNKILARILREAKANKFMPEVERRAQAGIQQFVRAVPNPIDKKQQIRPFWPHDVWVVPHPDSPGNLQHALALCAKVRNDEYETWTRADDGGWYAEVVNVETGEKRPLGDEFKWPGKMLPWAVLHAGVSENVYGNMDCDLLELSDNLNAHWTELFNVIRYQGHTPVVYQGENMGSIAGGPGGISHIGQNESLTALTLNPQLGPALEITKQLARATALVLRQPPAAFSTDPSHAASGTARRIENQVAEDARAERVEDVIDFEETQLLPILAEQHRLFSKGPHLAPDVEFEVHAEDLPDFEDPLEFQTRLTQLYSLGLMKGPEVLVKLGHAHTTEEADAQIDKVRADQYAGGQITAPPQLDRS